jgi:hypothetical protein
MWQVMQPCLASSHTVVLEHCLLPEGEDGDGLMASARADHLETSPVSPAPATQPSGRSPQAHRSKAAAAQAFGGPGRGVRGSTPPNDMLHVPGKPPLRPVVTHKANGLNHSSSMWGASPPKVPVVSRACMHIAGHKLE